MKNRKDKYQLLLSTLDSLIDEAPDKLKKYDSSNEEKLSQARVIHKSKFNQKVKN